MPRRRTTSRKAIRTPPPRGIHIAKEATAPEVLQVLVEEQNNTIEMIDEVLDRFAQIVTILRDVIGTLACPQANDKPLQVAQELRAEAQEQNWRKLGAAGIADIRWSWNNDGSARVGFDGRALFPLQAKLVLLLRILEIGGKHTALDGSSGWLLFDEVAGLFSKQQRRAVERSNVAKTIDRLRNALKAHNESPYFIQTTRTCSSMVRLRRRSLQPTAELVEL